MEGLIFLLKCFQEALNHQPSEETQQYIQKVHNCKWSTSENGEGSSSVPSLCKRLSEPDVALAFNPVSDVRFLSLHFLLLTLPIPTTM